MSCGDLVCCRVAIEQSKSGSELKPLMGQRGALAPTAATCKGS